MQSDLIGRRGMLKEGESFIEVQIHAVFVGEKYQPVAIVDRDNGYLEAVNLLNITLLLDPRYPEGWWCPPNRE